MKFLLVFAVVMVAFWVWRNNRLPDERQSSVHRKRPAGPAIMVACLQCGMHLPETEAIKGRDGSYCCTEHREQREGRSA
jgi:uncharacterized protein